MRTTQKDRPMRVSTPLGQDVLLITKLSGREALSELFQFDLEVVADNKTPVQFDRLMGQSITVELDLPGGKKRYFNGLCRRVCEGKRATIFTEYRLQIVPQLWLLTRRTQCRIFQHEDIPSILKKVLAGLDVSWNLQAKYHPRDHCIQFRESDFDFVSRLMEEEGIYYFFQHSNGKHQLIIADTPQGHVNLPTISKAIFEEVVGGNRPDLRVFEWEKSQELRSGKVTIWDHSFEFPQQNLEAAKTIMESVTVGKVTHKLKVADNDRLELYDFPGDYAHRYDGVDAGGGDKADELKKIFEDNQRSAKIRIEREAAASVQIRGQSNCMQFTPGYKFTLERHFNADGEYVLREVEHDARLSADYRSGQGETLVYTNRFTCFPSALPFRPPLRTTRSLVRGPQTATVVGPPGELIFCDKFGRVKVQFHWDREGKKDANSSCWVRVSQNWGGPKWGGMFIPHIGQEVIVEFEEGDPDRPLITGRVYNAEAMPPLELPAGKTKSIIRDHGGNEIVMEGHDGIQQIRMFSPYAETEFIMGAPHSPGDGFYGRTQHFMEWFIGKDWKQTVQGSQYQLVLGNAFSTVRMNQVETIGMNAQETIAANKSESVGGNRMEMTVQNRACTTRKNQTITIGGRLSETVRGNVVITNYANRKLDVRGNQWILVDGETNQIIKKDQRESTDGNRITSVKGNFEQDVQKLFRLNAKQVIIDAEEGIAIEDSKFLIIQCGESMIKLEKDGTITIQGKTIKVNGSSEAQLHSSSKVVVNGTEVEIKGTKIAATAQAIHEIKGTPVKINC